MNRNHSARQILVKTSAMTLAAACVIAGASAFSNRTPMSSLAYETETIESVWNGNELARPLSLAGLTAESLAASGVQANQVIDVVLRARTYLTDSGAGLMTSLSNVRSAKAAFQSLDRKVRTGTASAEELSAYGTAATTLANAESAKAAAIESLFQAATAGLGSDPIAALRHQQTNRGWEVPVKYRVVIERTEGDWVALRNALSHQATAERNGEDSDESQDAIVTAADGEPAVAVAAAGLENLAAVTAAWNTAIE